MAAIFWPISPALPMPVMIALPLQVNSSFTASQNEEFEPIRNLPNAGRLAADDLARRAKLFLGGKCLSLVGAVRRRGASLLIKARLP